MRIKYGFMFQSNERGSKRKWMEKVSEGMVGGGHGAKEERTMGDYAPIYYADL